METGFGTQEAKMRFVAAQQQDGFSKRKKDSGELSLDMVATGLDEQTALRQLNILAGVGNIPKANEPDAELVKLKQVLIADLKRLIIERRDDSKAGINPRNIIAFQGKLVELLLSVGNGNLQAQVDRITNSVFSQFNLQESGDLKKYRKELQGVISVVEFLKRRGKETLEPGLRRDYFTNIELDSEHQIDLFELIYRSNGEDVSLESMNLIQIKSLAPDPSTVREIQGTHQKFFEKFLVGRKKMELIRAGAEHLESDPRASEYKKQVQMLTDRLEDWYLQFLETYSLEDFNERKLEQAVKDFDMLVTNFFLDILDLKSDLPIEGLRSLSSDQQAYCVELALANIQENTENEPSMQLFNDKLSELSKRFQDEILKVTDKKNKRLVTEPLVVKHSKSTIWWPGGKIEKPLVK